MFDEIHFSFIDSLKICFKAQRENKVLSCNFTNVTRQTKQQRCPLPARQYSAGMEHSKQACRPLGCHGKSVLSYLNQERQIMPITLILAPPWFSDLPTALVSEQQLTTGIEIKLSSSCSAVGSRLCHFDPWRLIRTYRGFYVVLSEMHTYGIPTKAGEMTKTAAKNTSQLCSIM